VRPRSQTPEDLLEEADILRSNNRGARACFLAHIACEELGKLPILTTAAVSQKIGHDVNWTRIDSVLRSHSSKIKQVLFMDSIVGGEGLKKGIASYEADVQRMRTYTDMKNASLYSVVVEGGFSRPLEAMPCEFFDSFRPLAHGRLHAFRSMYLEPLRSAGGLVQFLNRMTATRVEELMETLTGPDGRKAFEAYEEARDDSKIRALFDRLIGGAKTGEETESEQSGDHSHDT
jgi:AbiV family abortive infection protein